ncbi:MAG TPA: GNAT family N-acetyltransferase [Opitutaceae bacterium]|jgi:predicted N-acetyltransferase YhbS|nr:GNAT family N-acetyltransferase [Opitutaceae bacterium]
MSLSVNFHIERLDPAKHHRDRFCCESVELTDFLQKRARKEMDALASACFVMVPADEPGRIAGFYTLSAAEIITTDLPLDLVKKLPRYTRMPAILLGRLARDLAWRGQHIGGLLLIDALRRSLRQSSEVGAVVVVTDPKDTRARAFYQRYGFQPLNGQRMFIPMKEIIARESAGWTA